VRVGAFVADRNASGLRSAVASAAKELKEASDGRPINRRSEVHFVPAFMLRQSRKKNRTKGTVMGRKPEVIDTSAVSAWIERVKKLIVIAIFSDEMLLQRFVLKGGNAIDLILGVGSRASMDIDLSMSSDFATGELQDVTSRIKRSLEKVFRSEGITPFDIELEPRPSVVTPDLASFWGGYRVTFKLIRTTQLDEHSNDLAALRRHALLVGASSKLQIDISKYEFCGPKDERWLDGVRILVYTPVMLACEKLRAICQQTKEYSEIVKRAGRPAAPRARDFVDIEVLMRHFGFDLASVEHWPLIKAIFAAKRVPLFLLSRVKEYREFHRTDFQAVKDSLKPGVKLDEFDDYFDDVVRLCERLETLGDS
jgi:hypothetical protein